MLLLPLVFLNVADESDKAYMKALYIKYHLIMFRMARALTSSLYDAEDVVSDACVSLIKNIQTLRKLDCDNLEGYIISTVKNAAYMHHRKSKSRREVHDTDALFFKADENASPDIRLLQECTIDELISAIDQLSDGDQTVIRMKYYQKASDSEIARVLGIREVSVRSRLSRARAKIYEFNQEE